MPKQRVTAILLGEGPGDIEVLTGVPFTGPTGRELRLEGTDLGVKWDEVALINAMACKPTHESTDKELAVAVNACRPLFNYQLQQARKAAVRPINQPLLVAGKYAGLAWFGKKPNVAKQRGFIRGDGSSYIFTWHPTYALFRDQWKRPEFLIDVARWWGLAVGTVKRLKPKVSTMSVAEAVKLAKAMGYAALDIETTFESVLSCRIKTIALGWRGIGVSWEWDKLTPRDLKLLAEFCAHPHTTKVLMNGYWFDIRVLNRHGFHFENVEDIRDGQRALVTTAKVALSYQVSLRLPTHAWKEDQDDTEDDKGAVHTEDVEKLKVYNATDTIFTAGVWHYMKSEAEWQEKRVQRLYAIHKQLSVIAGKMHSRGFLVDEPRRQRLSAELLQLHEARKGLLLKAVGNPNFTGTPDDMRALIYKRHSIKGIQSFDLDDPDDPSMYTDENMDTCSVNKQSLLALVIDPMVPKELKHIIDLYWHFNAPRKARNTYIESEKVRNALGADSRMRPGWNSVGTETMRWSCSAPNLMNLSEEKKEGDSLIGALPNMRQIYCAAPGYKLVHADWSQQEIRVMEAISGDELLRQALSTGDFYSAIAIKWFNLPADCNVKKENPAIRKSSKITYLAAQYAASLGTIYKQHLQQDRNASWSKIKVLYEKGFLRTFTGIQDYWKAEEKRVMACGYSEGRLLGGRRVYPAPPTINPIVNYPVQRTAGEMAAIAMIEIDRELTRAKIDGGLVTILHDAFDVEVRDDQVNRVKDILQKCMEGPWTIDGRTRLFPVDIKVGQYWSEL